MRFLFHILPIFILIGFQQFWQVSDRSPAIGDMNALSTNTGYSKDDYDVIFYKLDLNVSDTSIYIAGSASIKVKVVVQQMNNVSFDLVNNYLVDSVIVNNISAGFLHDSDLINIELPGVFVMGQFIDLVIYYHGKGYDTIEETGIYNRSADPFGKYTYTLSEPFSAKYWFPCKQILKDKADSSYVFITTDSTLKAGSNGRLDNIVQLPDGKVRYEWKSHHPIAYYLISMAVGRYVDYSFYVYDELNNDSILVVNYVYPEPSLEQNKSNIDETANFILFYSKIYGPYPYADEKYGHCLVPLGGGMEHQTMTTLGGFSYLLVAHELAHQWFGDYITCSTWQDIWINEGFASYSEYLVLENLDSEESAIEWMANAHNYVKNRNTGSIFLPEKDTLNADRIFDYALSYKKGAAIIHMIRQEVGNDDAFFMILRKFLQTYKNSNASGEDLKNFLELQTGKDFDNFFNQWYYGQGYPHFNLTWSVENDTLFINSLQETTSGTTPLFNTLMQFEATYSDGSDTIISFRQIANYQEFKEKLSGRVVNLKFDPHHWLLADVDNFGYINKSDNHSGLYTVWPNPVKDELTILFKNEPSGYSVRLVDLSGKIIYAADGTDKYTVINLKPYHKSPYILLILMDNNLYATKIIKI
jgi:aminopeptidase N